MRCVATIMMAFLWTGLSSQPSAAVTAAEQAEKLKELCKRTKCRPPGVIKLRTQGRVTEFEHAGAPYVEGNVVIVMPGDAFDIELDFSTDGKLVQASLPNDAPRKDHRLHIEFNQSQEDESMLLSIRNDTAATIKYKAVMGLLDGRIVETSSCPVMAGLSAFEVWPHPISQLILTNFRQLGESDNKTCE